MDENEARSRGIDAFCGIHSDIAYCARSQEWVRVVRMNDWRPHTWALRSETLMVGKDVDVSILLFYLSLSLEDCDFLKAMHICLDGGESIGFGA